MAESTVGAVPCSMRSEAQVLSIRRADLSPTPDVGVGSFFI